MLAMALSISSSECSRSTNSPALLTVVVRLRDGGVRLVATGGEERTPDSWVGQRVEAVVVRPVNPDQPAYTTSLTALTYEGLLEEVNDRADALVCAWVGAKYLLGEAVTYGDGSAAIWVP